MSSTPWVCVYFWVTFFQANFKPMVHWCGYNSPKARLKQMAGRKIRLSESTNTTCCIKFEPRECETFLYTTVFHADLHHSYELMREITGFSFWPAFIHRRIYLSMKQKKPVILGNLILFWCRKQSRIFVLSGTPSLIVH